MSNTIKHNRGRHYPYLDPDCPIAFHLRRCRQWYGPHGISQLDLARIAGVSDRVIWHAEKSCELQPSIEAMLRIAAAIGRPLEELVAPKKLQAIRKDVEKRRAELEKRQGKPSVRPGI